MESLQTKVFIAPPVGGNYFGIIPTNGKYVPAELSFLFCQERLVSGVLLNVYTTDVWFVQCIRVLSLRKR